MTEEEDLQQGNFELPFIQKKVQKEFKKEVEKRREELENLVVKTGFKNARKMHKSLASHYNVSERMIYKDFNWIKGNLKPDLREIKIDLYIARDKILNESLMLLNNATNFEERSKAIIVLINATKFYREELEAWGEKEKIADKVNLSQNAPAIIQIIEKSNEEIKEGLRKEREINSQQSNPQLTPTRNQTPKPYP